MGGGRLCSFSPCIEQVQRTCSQLEGCGFVDIEVVECLQRSYEVKSHALTLPNVGFSSVQSASEFAYSGKKLVHPSLSQQLLVTAQPTRRSAGHTGYLTFSTLPPNKDV